MYPPRDEVLTARVSGAGRYDMFSGDGHGYDSHRAQIYALLCTAYTLTRVSGGVRLRSVEGLMMKGCSGTDRRVRDYVEPITSRVVA